MAAIVGYAGLGQDISRNLDTTPGTLQVIHMYQTKADFDSSVHILLQLPSRLIVRPVSSIFRHWHVHPLHSSRAQFEHTGGDLDHASCVLGL